MAAMADTTQATDNSHHPNTEIKTQTPKISLYEQSREERIKENLQRMQQLGLKDLSNSLLDSSSRISSRSGRGRHVNGSKSPVTPQTHPLPPPSASLRRSSRLQNATPVTYSEVVLAKKDEILEDVELKLGKSEVYTEEHEKLLGNTERSWTLFVDGYGSDGRRIYDCVKGKTCHQCRQKTLGHRTHCCKCNMVQGQFCGDCLYMRYGEHVLEAIENPNWVCPVCRGICNCSLCRQSKGWAPTGSLYRKISQMGFKSVAHYLIQTRRVKTNVEKKPDNVDQVFAKRSLSFPASDLPSEESSEDDKNQMPQSGDDGLNSEKKEKNACPEQNPTINHESSARKSLQFTKYEAEFENGESTEINLEVHGQLGISEPDSGNKKDDDFKCEPEKELHFPEEEPNDSPMTLETIPAKKDALSTEPNPDNIEVHGQLRISEPDSGNKKDDDFKCEREKELHFSEEEPNGSPMTLETIPAKKDALFTEPNPDNIAGRLTQEHGKDISHNDGNGTVNHVVSEKKMVKDRETHNAEEDIVEGYNTSESSPKLMKRPVSAMRHSPDNITERLKQRRRQGNDHDEEDVVSEKKVVKERETHNAEEDIVKGHIASESSPKPMKRPASAMKHSPDSIAERLKQRRRQGKDHDEHGLPGANESVSDAKQVVEENSSGKESKANLKHSSGTNMDCIAGRLRPRNKAL
ncbi:hypothetical protein PTKIN_Ptkin08bG0172100 [Pterospermum kingtungense]